MSVQQGQSQQQGQSHGSQYNAASPTSKAVTIIDNTVDDAPYWTIKSFFFKGQSNVSVPKTDTKKVRVKVTNRHWPFGNTKSNANNTNGKVLSWFFGKKAVITHTKLDYDVYSGFVDDITKKNGSHILELYVTNVDDIP